MLNKKAAMFAVFLFFSPVLSLHTKLILDMRYQNDNIENTISVVRFFDSMILSKHKAPDGGFFLEK